MPAQPRWILDLDRICNDIAALPRTLVERNDIERILGVGRRRAQQILEGCSTDQVGASSLTTPDALISHLRGLASGKAVHYEGRRRHKVAQVLAQLQSEWTGQPRVLIEAPTRIVNQQMASLPDGVELAPGQLTVRFTSAPEGLEKLLALAMAIGNDLDAFERRTAV